MPKTPWDRRELLKAISAGVAASFLTGRARNAAAQPVKWSEGTEPPKLKAPPNACDCHHHIYDSRYPVDPKAVLRPADTKVGPPTYADSTAVAQAYAKAAPVAYGAATGRTHLSARRSRTTLCCLISSSCGPPTRKSATISWSRTRRCSTTIQRVRKAPE